VIVLEADLRRPSFARYLHLPGTGGLASVLSGVGELRDELVAVDVNELRPIDGAAEAGMSFSVLPAAASRPARSACSPAR
jgi:hypothetical protein